jgi:2-methylisocitrate lyase-like PEP mutase family enzyme
MLREDSMHAGVKIRESIAAGRTMHVVGANDALSAVLIEQSGFDAVYVGSYSTSATFLGKPDLDLMSKTDRLTLVRNIVKSVSIPVIADIEEGYGNAISVMDVVSDFEASGVAAVQIGDQDIPSKCPVMQGIPPATLISVEEMCGKIRSAVSARRNSAFTIIVRTDVIGTVSRQEYYSQNLMEEVVRRSNAYVRAGADAVMIMALNENELSYYAERIEAPLVGIYAPAEPIPFRAFRERRYAMAIGTITTLYMYVRSLVDGLRELKDTEDWNAISHRLASDEEFFRILGLDKYRDIYNEFSIP